MRKIDVPLALTVCAVSIVVAAIFITAPGNESANGAANQESNYWEWIFSAAFWTAAFTGVLTVSTVLLWRETRRLARLAETQSEDTKASIAAAQKNADAAVAANRLQLEIFDAENPPLLEIGVGPHSDLIWNDGGFKVTFGIGLSNLRGKSTVNVLRWEAVGVSGKDDKDLAARLASLGEDDSVVVLPARPITTASPGTGKQFLRDVAIEAGEIGNVRDVTFNVLVCVWYRAHGPVYRSSSVWKVLWSPQPGKVSPRFEVGQDLKRDSMFTDAILSTPTETKLTDGKVRCE